MFNKVIESKFKAILKLFTSIWKINGCYWKAQKLNKKEKIFKLLKTKHKVKPADSQPTILLETSTQFSSQNFYKTQSNCFDRRLSSAIVEILAIGINLVNIILNNNINSGEGQNKALKNMSQVIS